MGLEASMTKEEVNVRLLYDYSRIGDTMHPMGDDPAACRNKGEALLLGLEMQYRGNPRGLYKGLQDDIPPVHHERLETVLGIIEDFEDRIRESVRCLKDKREEAKKFSDVLAQDAETADPIAWKVVNGTREAIHDEIWGIMALLSHRQKKRNPEMPSWQRELQSWQTEEYALRGILHSLDENHLAALRLFDLLLLENPRKNPDKIPLVLEPKHAMRWPIKLHHRVLRLISALRASFVLSRGYTHQQPEHLLRRSGEAYIYHPLQAALDTVLHHDIYMISDPKYHGDPAIHGIVMPAHDLDEASRMIEKFVAQFEKRTGRIDTKIDNGVKSGFGDRETARLVRRLALINPHNKGEIMALLRALSLNTILRDEELQRLMQSGCAGSEITQALLQRNHVLREEALRTGHMQSTDVPIAQPEKGTTLRFDMNQKSEPWETYPSSTRLTEDNESYFKDDVKLLQILTLLDGDARHEGIVAFYGDRINNIDTLVFPDPQDEPEEREKKLHKIHRYLHYTVIRPIAYGVLEHSWSQYPPSNILRTLIQKTLVQYKRLRDEYAYEKLTDEDENNIETLEAWLEEREEVPLPDFCKGILQ